MFYVKSWLKTTSTQREERFNGVVGPFEKRDTAERALIALCQAGQATAGAVIDDADIPQGDAGQGTVYPVPA